MLPDLRPRRRGVVFEYLANYLRNGRVRLPVIEFKDGSAPTFFDETELVFCKTNPRDIVVKLLYYLGHRGEL